MAIVVRPSFDLVHGAKEAAICNIAIGHVGGEIIKNTDEDTKQARVCKAVYAQTRDELLRTYPFNFATRIVDIPIDATPVSPLGEFTYAYKAEEWIDFAATSTGTPVSATITVAESVAAGIVLDERLIGREVSGANISPGTRIIDYGENLGNSGTLVLDRAPLAAATLALSVHIPVLKIVGIEANDTNDFAAIGGGARRRILCNVGDGESLEMKYIHQVIDPNEFDSMFTHALSLRIASKIALDMTKNGQIAQMMQQEFSAIFQAAKISSSEEKQIDSSESWWSDRQGIGDTQSAQRG